jgi:putative selenate reductase
VISALELLEDVRDGNDVSLGSRIVIIGGGDTAMDASRVALRLTGRAPTVLYRRTKEEMPARGDDREGALEEGIVIEELVSPTRILRSEGRIRGIECIRNRSGDAGEDGRRRPIPVPGSEFTVAADTIVIAVGQSPDFSFLEGSVILRDSASGIVVHPVTGLAASRLYAGGDAVGGPESIVAACADGRRAAEAIRESLGLAMDPAVAEPALSPGEILEIKRRRARRENRSDPATIPPEQRSGFDLIEATLTEEAAKEEAGRCLQCSSICDKCVEVCPNRANQVYEVVPVVLRVPVLACANGILSLAGERKFEIRQTRQIVHLHELCNDCGNCATFCVHYGLPYQEKPRLFFEESRFLQQTDNAFHFSCGTLHRREGGRESRLTVSPSGVVYEDDWVSVELDGGGFHITSMSLKMPFTGSLDLTGAAEMWVIRKCLEGGQYRSHPADGAGGRTNVDTDPEWKTDHCD